MSETTMPPYKERALYRFLLGAGIIIFIRLWFIFTKTENLGSL